MINVGGGPRNYVVKAVVEDIPAHSSIQFDLLISDLNAKDLFPEQMLTSWFMISGVNYVLLKEGVIPEEMEAQFLSLVEKVIGDRLSHKLKLQTLNFKHKNLKPDLKLNDIKVGFDD